MAIREVKPGVWDVSVYGTKREDGTRPRATKRVRGTWTDAKLVETKLMDDRNDGKPIGPTDALSEYIDLWLEDKEGRVQPQTLHNYTRAADSYIKPHIGKLKLRNIKPSDIRRMDQKLKAAGLSGSTRLYAYRVVSMVFRQAVHDHEIALSPCDSVKPPLADPPEPRSLEPEEVLELLRLLRGTPVYGPALLAYDTGMRREELLALQWSDIDFASGVVTIQRAVEQVNGNVRIKKPKTKRSRRKVKLSDPAVALLREHRREQVAFRALHANVWRDEGLVFPSRYYHDAERPMGRVWTPYAFSKAWRVSMNEVNAKRLEEHVKAGGSEDGFEAWQFGPHRLRHTFITHNLKQGVRLEVVSRAAGHSNSHVTLTRYSHVLDEEQAETAVVTGSLLEQIGKTP
jgi:integrase